MKINENKQAAVDSEGTSTQSAIYSAKTDCETEWTSENIGDGVTDDTNKEKYNSTLQDKVEESGSEASSKPSL